jgi:hypothetical protein
MWVLEFNDDYKNAVISNTVVYHLLCYMVHNFICCQQGCVTFPFFNYVKGMDVTKQFLRLFSIFSRPRGRVFFMNIVELPGRSDVQ